MELVVGGVIATLMNIPVLRTIGAVKQIKDLFANTTTLAVDAAAPLTCRAR
jgi:hypothetical protein